MSGHIFKLVRDVRADAGKHLRLTSSMVYYLEEDKIPHTSVGFYFVSYRE